MRRPIAFFLLGFVATASQAENRPVDQSAPVGLTKDVVPRSYLIHLEPNIETRVTFGVESIEIEVLRPTTQIVLNALDTLIAKATIEIGDRQEELTPELDSNQQTVLFDLKSVLQPGKYTLTIKFQSRILEEPHGLFVQQYEGELGAAENLLATRSRTADARRIFPCWDEPTFRARFQLSVKTEKQNSVLSDMPVLVEQLFGPDQKIVVFEKTPATAINTVSLVCGKLEWLEDEVAGVKLRIVTTSGKKGCVKYAMDVTKQLLPFFSDYFATPFPCGNLDQIAFPADTSDSEEIGSRIVHDETTLLCDPEICYDPIRQKIFLAIAQKIVRQWSDDYVPTTTPDALWLNEAISTWLAKKAADHFNPRWKIWLHAAVEKEAVMALDAGKNTHAIRPPLAGTDQCTNARDVIIVHKPWLLLRMLENFVGEDSFREGVRAYLAAHRVSETSTEDLWVSLEQITGKPIKKIALGWTDQPGFPLLKMTSQCVNGNRVISLDQVPFVLAPGNEIPPEEWDVPVGVRSAVSSNEIKYAFLDKLSKNFDLAGCGGIIQANAGNVGYFRVLYEPALFNDLLKNVEKLPESDRLNLITDTWALVESRGLPASYYFDFLEELRRDDSLAVWESAVGTGETVGALRLVDRLEQGRPSREAYQRYICSLFGPKFRELGWEEKAGEDAETQGYRAILIEALGFFGDRDVIDESFKRFVNYRQNPSSLVPSLRSAVIANVGRYSSSTVNHELLLLVGSARSSEEKQMYLRALSLALDPELARETLQYFLSDKVKAADASRALEYFATEADPDIAWAFVVSHLKQIQEQFGLPRQIRLLSSIANRFTDNQRADEVLAFAKEKLPPAGVREVENSTNQIRFRAMLKTNIVPAIDDWIKAKLQGSQANAARHP